MTAFQIMRLPIVDIYLLAVTKIDCHCNHRLYLIV